MAAEEKQVELLIQLARKHRSGFTYKDVKRELGWKYSDFARAVRQVREHLCDDGEWAFPCVPNGQRGRWLYFLTKDVNEAHRWVRNRIQDMRARLTTYEGQLGVYVKWATGREKRLARLLHTNVQAMNANIEVMEEQAEKFSAAS